MGAVCVGFRRDGVGVFVLALSGASDVLEQYFSLLTRPRAGPK